MESPEPATPADETFAQVLALLKDQYKVNDSQIAKRIGAHVSTVNNWAHGKANPRPGAIRALAAEFPLSGDRTEARFFAAIGKRAPAPLTQDRRDAVLREFDRLTEEQQELLLIQARAVADSNEQ